MSEHLTEAASHFLFYYKGHFPFNFLGDSVGYNPRRVSSRSGIIYKPEEKLAIWRGKLLSIG